MFTEIELHWWTRFLHSSHNALNIYFREWYWTQFIWCYASEICFWICILGAQLYDNTSGYFLVQTKSKVNNNVNNLLKWTNKKIQLRELEIWCILLDTVICQFCCLHALIIILKTLSIFWKCYKNMKYCKVGLLL